MKLQVRTSPAGPKSTAAGKKATSKSGTEVSGTQDVIHDFVVEAKKLEEKFRNEKSLRRPLFNERDFREMAINWTTSLGEMRDIEDIDNEKVEMYGGRFLPLIKRYHASYEAMMGKDEDRDIDQNHRNVIDLVTDDDVQDDDDSISIEEQPSKYFINEQRAAFNAEIQRYSDQQAPRESSTAPKSNPRGGSSKAGAGRGRGRRSSGCGSKKTSKKRNSSSSKGGEHSGVSKKKGSSKKSSSGSASNSNVFKPFAKKPGGGGGGGSSYSGAIGMMPT